MINILLKDKNGVEVNNGDILRIVSISPEYQEEYDPFYRFQNGTYIKWQEIVINPQEELDTFGYCGIGINEDFTKEMLLELFDLPTKCNEEEYQECVIDVICEELKIKPKTENEFFEIINGFEIVGNSFKTPELLRSSEV
ncbi:hypothetical protein [Soonwooa purpurea]